MAESRVALVIGNADYRHARILPNPKNDAEAVATLLSQIGFAAGDVTIKLDLDYKALREAVRQFAAKAAGADIAIVYYAGHGIEVAGENYLVPVDAKLTRDRDLEYEAVTLTSVLDAVTEARKLKLVILDACRDNPLSHKISLKAGVTRKVVRGLERIEPQGDVLVAYAAKAGTVALDGTGRHSPYAEALLKHLSTPGVDVFRLFGRISETVLEATKGQQEPWLYGRPSGDALALVPAPVKTAASPVLPPPPPASFAAPSAADGLSAMDAARICREVASIGSLSVLRAMADQHKGTPAGPCIAARMDELAKADVAKAKAETETVLTEAPKAKADAEKKVSLQAAPGTPSPMPPVSPKASAPAETPAPLTECDRLAAPPGYAPAGLQGVSPALLDAARAVPACRDSVARYPAEARLQAWLARSLQKAGLSDEARRWYERAAEKDHPVALNNLGNMYTQGKVVTTDHAKARGLFEKAAAQGEPNAMHNLGVLLRDGRGGPRDYAMARIWFERAAEKGQAVSMLNLGFLYRDGKGVMLDHGAARSWFEKAVERGDVAAMSELGFLYQSGLGVPLDYASARSWYEKGAAKGSASAMNRLGTLFHNGHGVERSWVVARGWYEKAAERGDFAAMHNLALLYSRGHGVATSPQTAARHLLMAARAGSATTRRDLDGEMSAWPTDTRRAVQELLAASGDYRGSLNGIWDQASRDAAKAYYARSS